MKKITYYIVLIMMFLSANNLISQTSSFGAYEVYTHESKLNSLGYLNVSFKLPEYLNSKKLNFKGVEFTHNYLLGEIGSYVFAENNRLRFITEGTFRIAAALTEDTPFSALSSVKSKYYLGLIDVFSLNIGSEYTFVINNGYAFTARLMFTLVNVGGMFSIREKGTLEEDAIGSANLIPLIIKPSLFVDFGRSGLGVSFMFNPVNFLSYKYAPKELFDSKDMGILVNDSSINQFAIQISFVW
ncbi:MAG: hypothetical protein HND52_16425 [Ignavibacteriae bacterium]|nr:hypothetical protein [Ignavibacteriota bacterium]NOG99544.1 hypothetical protein [Ignavibacteriota bacterium]